ncbi:prephenate/arogenate dehydrogenase [Dolichospermum circinale CS-1225]|uniref:Prephenate/arogenate dehydrogenase n=1 Tax=Dolichospermum circinale CS-537/01 TaxID=3021739 RepID=A0ABT5A5C1_9CYAN|nr:prephenate/arogenate dehydrogenase [Dolichospermum circinale]MDB9460720.1 prephenate/arogenate dehydrogenase [Dolichospermum circinale CS-545/17]MDB9467669.1 prephenate/arogenate dehydrogenase [Dolichospermum circinale CS-539/09]MDB9471222.1 prephenate/arogenate dehydrogenase [Dolichospermum circinale CS-539]MDB9487145.1 prephenate/arogenate dehydrogenase [Dolichospermum circinale CS-537/01]MDB9523697.1 prephenate/arogenate dehydrogenase [Dolichospermum circinale CS-1225]
MKIGILGLGLIGGCLGFDLRSQGHHVLGVSCRESTCVRAVEIGSVDQASLDLSLLASAEVVFICTPIGLIIPRIKELIGYLPKTTIITDVGSVKTPIVKAISPLWENFIGGHPMAGKTDVGIESAQRNLFVNRPYVLTPIETTASHIVTIIEEIVRSLGSVVYHCQPEQHDQAVSWISHLPVIVSASLIAACLSETDPEIAKLAQNFASSGFRDTSRVGGGNPELGVMMAQYNRQALLNSLYQYRENLDEFIHIIEGENWELLAEKMKLNRQALHNFLE